MNYYNEHDHFAAEWLRKLMERKLIPDGHVDDRDLQEVTANDLQGYTQCHFFAGIGGWSNSLQLSGWAADRPVWTGSPPCQPFSNAGKQLGTDDERHLWPTFFNLIRECRPPVVFGEQVASAIGTGWWDALQADMEAEDYAAGMVVLPACSVGAPHIRQRLFFVAERLGDRSSQGLEKRICIGRVQREEIGAYEGKTSELRSDVGRLSNSATERWQRISGGREAGTAERGEDGRMADDTADRCNEECSDGQRRGAGDPTQRRPTGSESGGSIGRVALPGSVRRERMETSAPGDINDRTASKWSEGEHGSRQSGTHRVHQHAAGPLDGIWRDADWLFCRDGKWRPVEPGTFPLAHGVSNRVGRLRGYGNAIVPQVAAEVIMAYMDGGDQP